MDEQTDRLIPVESEQAVMGEIRELRAAGKSYRRIAEQLTRHGIVTKTGRNAWTHQSVRSVVMRKLT